MKNRSIRAALSVRLHTVRELAERQKREAQLKREQERRQRLFVQARNWRQAADVRAFVAAVREHNEVQLQPGDVEAWAALGGLGRLGRWRRRMPLTH